MTVYVVDRWDEEDLCDSEVVSVFLKEENAKRYKKGKEEELIRNVRDADEDEVNEIPKYTWRITKLPIEELAVENVGQISDGNHTFDELYYHRMMLFSVICNTYKDKAWKSWKHSDGEKWDGYFICGIDTPNGNYTYHYQDKFWNMFNVKELEFAPKWDGHEPKDIVRLLSLVSEKENK